jgi:hypothetical protein
MRWLWMILTIAVAGAVLTIPTAGQSSDYVVYSVYKELDLGNPGESPKKDFFVNIGSSQGVREGATLEVLRRISTYDLMTEKLYKDLLFPIARLKVIHVETNAAIARLEKMLPPDKTPALSPRAVMVGDSVRVTQ